MGSSYTKAVEKDSLFDLEHEKQIFDLRQLIEISKVLNSTLDYNLLLDSILFTCMGQMRVFNAGIFTRKRLRDENFSLHRNFKGFDIPKPKEYVIPAAGRVLKALAQTLRCFTLDELKELSKGDEGYVVLESLGPDIIIPLTSKGHLHGIIVLGNRIGGVRFTESEQEYLLHIAGFAAIAIHNAYLFEMTTTDMMTKLKTRHFFENTLTEYLKRRYTGGKKLSLMLIDVDHFKQVNDDFGHVFGDMVIVQTARIIMDNIRQNDVAARYGGEEFIIILPDADRDEAYLIAERIRKTVEAQRTTFQNKTVRVTVSIGVAQYTKKEPSHINVFIDEVDTALYYSKRNGRNRTTVLD
jgi:two-component system, cell cycle response regulator